MSRQAADGRPNVLWIMADQHNAKCTSWGDYPTDVRTPNLQRLADEGTRFERAFAQNPVCTPSRTSFLTGQYPSNHGCYANGGTAPDHLDTVFGLAGRLGYRTGIFGKVHTPSGLVEPDVDEFEVTHCPPDGRSGRTGYAEELARRGALEDRDDVQLQEWVETAGDGAGQPIDARPSALDFEDSPEHWAAERAAEFAREEEEDPFFAWVSLHRPHIAYVPALEFWELYPEDDLELPPSADEDLSDKPPNQRAVRADQESGRHAVFEPRTYEGLRRRALRGYLGCITQVDAAVGVLLDALESAGLREDTIVVYCSDHGDFAVEHGLLEKAPGISYDATTRVPFVWSWPGRFREGAVCPELVEAVDLFPTLARLLGDREVQSADGSDLTGFLHGTDTDPVREYAVTENAWTKCVRTREQKLTVYPRGFFGDGSDEFLECYDLAEDPWETTNIAEDPEARDVVARHRALLTEFLATSRRPWTCPGVETEDAEGERPGRDPCVDPRRVRDHLEEAGGSNYL